jgi:hypothetical protein
MGNYFKRKLSTRDADAESTFKDIVRGLYAGIMGRSVDEAGLYASVELLHKLGIRKGVPILARSLAYSEENRQRLHSEFGKFRHTIPAEIPHRFSHAFSIGDHCVTANFMRNAGLRRSAGPFDWIFSSLDVVAHCIEDDFEKFLDRNYYIRHDNLNSPPSDEGCEHTFYRDNFNIASMFNHRSPTIDINYDYLNRCVERFRTGLNSGDGVLLVSVTKESPQFDRNLARLRNALSQFGSHHLIIIKVSTTNGDDKLRLSQLENLPDCRVFDYLANSTIGPMSFSSELDDDIVEALLRGYGGQS